MENRAQIANLVLAMTEAAAFAFMLTVCAISGRACDSP
jgi:hypothetical protein